MQWEGDTHLPLRRTHYIVLYTVSQYEADMHKGRAVSPAMHLYSTSLQEIIKRHDPHSCRVRF